MSKLSRVVVALALTFSLSLARASETHQADIVVYGDASGGVIAAVAAKKQGKSVILVSQYGHLGGLSSSGLGWTEQSLASLPRTVHVLIAHGCRWPSFAQHGRSRG